MRKGASLSREAQIDRAVRARLGDDRKTFSGLIDTELRRKHRVTRQGKPVWLSLERIILDVLVHAQMRGEKRAFKLLERVQKELQKRPTTPLVLIMTRGMMKVM